MSKGVYRPIIDIAEYNYHFETVYDFVKNNQFENIIQRTSLNADIAEVPILKVLHER